MNHGLLSALAAAMGKQFAIGTLGILTCALVMQSEREARACGGCFHPPAQVASDITDERMLLSVSQTQTTLFDQIKYAGNPATFAWVLPIKGTVDVGLSADVMFDSIDALTATQINPPNLNCPQSGGSGCSASSPSSATGFDSENGGGVTVTKSQNVGPYQTVQLHSTDPQALNNWLTQNGYDIPSDVTPVIDAYVTEGFDFLVMKLLPDAGVQSMRPVRVTMPGASLSLPLRMAAIGTGATVGITIWIVADGRYEPQNFPFFHIDDADLVWDWNTNLSNYTTLRAQNEANLVGKGWEIESSLEVSRQSIENLILSSGASQYESPSSTSETPAGTDYLPVGDPSEPAGDADGGAPYQSAETVRSADIEAVLNNDTTSATVRVTRIRSDISHAAMTTDLLLQASSDQKELSNQRVVTHMLNAPACPSTGVFGCDASGRPIVGGAGLLIGAVGLLLTRMLRKRAR
jgi:Uncharacterized protein conserved in bacteria (DUF2330)